MSKKKRVVFFFIDMIMVGVLVLIDRYTKMLAVEHLKGSKPYKLIPDVFEFRYLENRGRHLVCCRIRESCLLP